MSNSGFLALCGASACAYYPPRDRSLTLSQNYKRLGLSSRLTAPTGGIEKKPRPDQATSVQAEDRDSLSICNTLSTTKLEPKEVKVERDPATGRIIRILREDKVGGGVYTRYKRGLKDPLDNMTDDEKEAPQTREQTSIVAMLEAQADQEAAAEAKNKRPRQQSRREEEWIAQLISKYGNDIRAMSRDRKLNPMQQSEGDIGRRVRTWMQRKQKVG